jgi:alpha-beta hydrolase superfamily lysophospholipase
VHRPVSVTIISPDGLRLAGTFLAAVGARQGAVLVHGGGVTREEGGFFTRLAAGLAEAGVASLRFDLRGHGGSEGRQEDLTLAGVLGDIRAAITLVRSKASTPQVALLGASFSGGICAYYAATHPTEPASLVLLNPLLNYKKRLIDDKDYWHDDQISAEAARELTEQGYIAHSSSFKLGRPLLNEVFYLRPHTVLDRIQAPTLIVHGTKDTFISVDSSRWAAAQLTVEHRLIEIHGAQHGFAVHNDPAYAEPQTQRWQAAVVESTTAWVAEH